MRIGNGSNFVNWLWKLKDVQDSESYHTIFADNNKRSRHKRPKCMDILMRLWV